jgi:uncharacterized protein with PIN domain
MDDKSKGTQGDGSLPSMPLRLLADEMLGRLARWLRLLGYDTLYETGLSDHQLAARARHEDRVLLTRDRELARRKGIRCLLVRSQELEEQLEQVIDTLGAPAAESEPRCSSCNAQLISISRQEASLHVPAFVLDTHKRFRYCAQCRRVYWQGSHWQRVTEIADRLRHREGRE